MAHNAMVGEISMDGALSLNIGARAQDSTFTTVNFTDRDGQTRGVLTGDGLPGSAVAYQFSGSNGDPAQLVTTLEPTDDTHLVNKRYVDTSSQMRRVDDVFRMFASTPTGAVHSGTFPNDTVTNFPGTVDDIPLLADQRILIGDETSPAGNGSEGLWVVVGSGPGFVTLQRSSDFQGTVTNLIVRVTGGTVNPYTTFIQTTPISTLDGDSVLDQNWQILSGSTELEADSIDESLLDVDLRNKINYGTGTIIPSEAFVPVDDNNKMVVVDTRNGLTRQVRKVEGVTVNPDNGSITTDGTITAAFIQSLSDIRLKKNVTVLDRMLPNVDTIRYTLLGHDDNYRIGVSAQELNETYPELVHEGNGGTMSVDYNGLCAVLLGEVRRLSELVDKLAKAVEI
jgi:hypothetical protein